MLALQMRKLLPSCRAPLQRGGTKNGITSTFSVAERLLRQQRQNGDFSPDCAKRCENLQMCGEVCRTPVRLASGSRDDIPQIRYSVAEKGVKLAKAVKVGEIVGAECAN